MRVKAWPEGLEVVRVVRGGQEEVGKPRRKCGLGEQNDQQCPESVGVWVLQAWTRAGGGTGVSQPQLQTR